MILVFFGSSRARELKVFSLGPRAWRRRPLLLWAAICSRLARSLGGEPSHVAPAYGEVLEITAKGLFRIPIEWYAVYRRGLTECWEVPEVIPPTMPHSGRLEVWRSVLGVPGAFNCVSMTAGILRSSGIAVPEVETPSELRDWLASQGYRHVEFGQEPQ